VSEIVVRGCGHNAEQVIANMREQLDVQFGQGQWHLIEDVDDSDPVEMGGPSILTILGGNPAIEVTLSPGGQTAHVSVTMHIEAELLAEVALPRMARA
jgi:hypothetical protein